MATRRFSHPPCQPAKRGRPSRPTVVQQPKGSKRALPERSETPDQHWLVQAVWATAGSHPSTSPDATLLSRTAFVNAAQTGRDPGSSRHQSEGRSPTCRQRLGGLLGSVSSSRAIGRWCRLGRPSTQDATTPGGLGDLVHQDWWLSRVGVLEPAGEEPDSSATAREIARVQ